MAVGRMPAGGSLPARWYVLRTKVHREKEVAELLRERGIETYFPLLKLFRKHRQRGERQIEPLFPCYVFARLLEPADCDVHIRRTSGLREVVRFGGHYPHFDPDIIAGLRRRETPAGYIRMRPSKVLFHAADPVRITGGLFAGRQGLFAYYLSAADRVCVLLESLERSIRVELPSIQVSTPHPCTVSAAALLSRP